MIIAKKYRKTLRRFHAFMYKGINPTKAELEKAYRWCDVMIEYEREYFNGQPPTDEALGAFRKEQGKL